MNICFIGGGNMAAALITGLLQKGFRPAQIRAVEIVSESRAQLEARFGIRTYDRLDGGCAGSDIVVLAVKPQQLFEAAAQLRPLLDGQLVISIAAGVRAADLSRWLGGYGRLVRAMPNTPATVLAGVSGLYAMPEVEAPLKQQAETVLGAIGICLWLEEEARMDAITAVSGSGPAYVFYFIEAMQQAAKELGFTPEQARLLSLETFLGAARLAAQSEEDAAVLRARVTSKGGSTERALQTMEEGGVKQHIIRAIHAAAVRSREMGDTLGNAG
ncbi:MAG: pyrroline-5-carboxylate reductase [Pseudomonadota bacterium]|jgi:pyrroline-5-carboxylate reductase